MTSRNAQPVVDDNVVDLRHYGQVLRRHKGLLLAGLLLGLLVGALAANQSAPTYTARTELVVQQIGSTDGGLGADGRGVNVATEQQIASSTTVAEQAQERLSSDASPEELLSGLQVTTPGNSSVLSFAYSSDDAATSQQRSQAFAEAYLELRRERGERVVGQITDSAEDRLAELQSELLLTRQAIASAPVDSAAARDAIARQDVVLSQMGQLQNRLGQLNTFSLEPGEIIQEASLPESDSAAIRAALVVSLGFLGLLVAAMAAFLLARADKRVRAPEDTERALALPVLANLGAGDRRGTEAVAHEALAVRLLVAAQATHRRTLAIASPTSAAHSTALASALAAQMARRGTRVVLVDGLGADPGAAGAGHSTAGGLRTVALAAPDGQALQPERVRRMVAEARADAEVVLLAMPPVLASADALLLAVESDLVVLVAETGVTEYGQLQASASHLEDMGSRVTGVVMLSSTAIASGTAEAAGRNGTDAHQLPAGEPVQAR